MILRVCVREALLRSHSSRFRRCLFHQFVENQVLKSVVFVFSLASSLKIGINDQLDKWLERSKEIENRPVRPLLSVERLLELFRRNDNPHGHHFVVHQHDHPIAGLHYDLRLQISESSSISFAIMYGLPGNPNSKRLNRNATETRVHNLWVCLRQAMKYEVLWGAKS